MSNPLDDFNIATEEGINTLKERIDSIEQQMKDGEITVNEARVALGNEPIEGGDVYRVQTEFTDAERAQLRIISHSAELGCVANGEKTINEWRTEQGYETIMCCDVPRLSLTVWGGMDHDIIRKMSIDMGQGNFDFLMWDLRSLGHDAIKRVVETVLKTEGVTFSEINDEDKVWETKYNLSLLIHHLVGMRTSLRNDHPMSQCKNDKFFMCDAFFNISKILIIEKQGSDHTKPRETPCLHASKNEQAKDRYAEIEEYRNKGCVTQNELLVEQGKLPVYGGDDIWFDVN